MKNGNMVIGTFKSGLLVRVGKDAHAAALKFLGAKTFEMNGRKPEGYITMMEDYVAKDSDLNCWINMAMSFNATLPTKIKNPSKPKKLK